MSPESAQGEWELGWLKTAARMVGNSELEKNVNRELQKRIGASRRVSDKTGVLPVKET